MSIATKAPISETRIGFAGVGFDVYERLIRATPARTAVRMAYDGRNLEIMVTGPVHDDYGWFLDRFINVVARVVGVRRRALGKTTWIRPEIERGIEADQCYVFDPAKVSAVSELLARKENDVALYPNPDLAVDVDISRPQTDRPAIYERSRCLSCGRSTASASPSRSFRAASTSTPAGADGFRSRHPTPRDGWSRKTPATWMHGKSGCGPGPSCCRERKAVGHDLDGTGRLAPASAVPAVPRASIASSFQSSATPSGYYPGKEVPHAAAY